MMFNSRWLRLLTAAAALAGSPVFAQYQGAMKRIGYLSHVTNTSPQPCLEELRKGLVPYGWIEDQNYRIEIRHADYDERLMPERARELAALRPDVLVASGVAPLQALRAATQTAPIVTMGSAGMLSLGLVKSLARPSTNITGFSNGEEEHGIKLLDVLAQALPSAKRIALILNERNPTHHKAMEKTKQLARQLGRDVVPVWFSGRETVEDAWGTVSRHKVDAVVVLPDLAMYVRSHALQAQRLRLPAIAQPRLFVQAGGFMSYGHGHRGGARCLESARYVDQVLRGRSPATIPIEENTELELSVNLKAAREVGVRLPPEIIARAAVLVE